MGAGEVRAGRRRPRLLWATATAAVALLILPSAATAAAPPTIVHLVGQKLVVSMDGTTPSASLLRRARLGRIGGVLIHRSNFRSAVELRRITAALQRAAAAGGRPPLLIAVDQEGGGVKTISWIPPTLSPPQMGALGSTTTARSQGRRTGTALRALGINTDFAPVADVPVSTASFMDRQGRTWSFGAARTGSLAGAFARGLADGRVVSSMKHFPGLGYARRNTDDAVVHITATKAQLAPGLLPYRQSLAQLPLVMLSNAVYTAYDAAHAAGWSRAVGTRLLRDELGFTGATITDSLDGAAQARHLSVVPLALRAAAAGTDLLLLTGSEWTSQGVYQSLVQAAKAGRVGRVRLEDSYGRILALKASLNQARPAREGSNLRAGIR